MKKSKFTYILLVIFFSLSLAGCDGENNIFKEDQKKDRVEYIIYENSELSLPLTSFNSLNPLYIENSSYFHFSKLIYEGLFDYDEKLEPVPCLVKTYTIGEDGKSIDLILKEGIKFHNGQTLSSKDVIFTLEMMKRAGNNSYFQKLNRAALSPTNQIISAKELSSHRLIISFKEPLGHILDVLTFPIIPESNKDIALEVDSFIPIGTGPYKYVEHNKFKELYLRSNEEFRDGEPEISHIVGKIFQDEESILTAFETGKLNVARASGIDWDKYESNKRISIREFVSNEYIAFAFNHEKAVFNSEEAIELKKAIIYGIDRNFIIDKVYLKHATLTDTPINPKSYLNLEEGLVYEYNKDKATEILNRSGYIDRDKNGIREDLLGNDLTLKTIVTVSDDLELKTLNIIKTNLKEIGIILDLHLVRVPDEDSQGIPSELSSGDYDLALLGWKQSIVPRYNYLLSSQMSNNYSFYKDESMDNLLNDLDKLWETGRRIDLIENFQKKIIEDLPYGTLYYKNEAILVDSFIEGPFDPNYYNIYNGLEKCYIKMQIK